MIKWTTVAIFTLAAVGLGAPVAYQLATDYPPITYRTFATCPASVRGPAFPPVQTGVAEVAGPGMQSRPSLVCRHSTGVFLGDEHSGGAHVPGLPAAVIVSRAETRALYSP